MAHDGFERSDEPRIPAIVLIVPRTRAESSEAASATLIFADALERAARELRHGLSRRLEAPHAGPPISRAIEDFAASMRRIEAEIYDAA